MRDIHFCFCSPGDFDRGGDAKVVSTSSLRLKVTVCCFCGDTWRPTQLSVDTNRTLSEQGSTFPNSKFQTSKLKRRTTFDVFMTRMQTLVLHCVGLNVATLGAETRHKVCLLLFFHIWNPLHICDWSNQDGENLYFSIVTVVSWKVQNHFKSCSSPMFTVNGG